MLALALIFTIEAMNSLSIHRVSLSDLSSLFMYYLLVL